MEEQFNSIIVTLDETLQELYETTKEHIDEYYGQWYERNDNTEDLSLKGHLMPVIKKLENKQTGEIQQVNISWYVGGITPKEGRHQLGNFKYIKKGKGHNYPDSYLKRHSKLKWEIKLAIALEKKLTVSRETINSITRIKKNTKTLKSKFHRIY